jgi:carboxymethylenebutenolidase
MTNTATPTAISTAQVKIPNQDLQIDAYLAELVGKGRLPSVIVVQEIFAVNIHHREMTEKLAINKGTHEICEIFDRR